MKMTFSWVEVFGRLEPKCLTDGARQFANLLVDDGGQPFLETIPWLDEGLRLAALVKGGQAELASWDREAWTADLTKHEANIHSLDDDACFQVVGLDSFERVLTAWRRFIQLPPDAAHSEEIEVQA